MRHSNRSLKKHQYTIYAMLGISVILLLIVIGLTVVPHLLEEDTTAPVIALKGSDHMLITLGTSFEDPGFTATDDRDGDITASVTLDGSVNTSLYGPQILTYTVTDSAGNVGTIQRTVIVQEFNAPVLTLSGNDLLYLPIGSDYVDPGYSAIDDVDGDITDHVQISDTVDFNTPGTYTLTYTVTDSSGNSTSLERTLNLFQPQSEEQAATPPGKIVYLTFDDGPGPHTQKLLNLLDKFNVDVTFFVTGQNEDYFNMIGEAHDRGHTIALHSFSHNFKEIYANETAYYKDLAKISSVCESQTGEKATIVRFPGGTSNTASKKICAGIMTSLTKSLPAKGYQYCDWNVDSVDAGGAKTASEVAANVIRDIQKFSRSYVLLHDTKSYSVEAIEEILYWGLSNGYTFLPLTPDTQMTHHRANN